MCSDSQTCGDCEHCQATDTFVTLAPVFREPTPPPSLPRDGGESETNR